MVGFCKKKGIGFIKVRKLYVDSGANSFCNAFVVLGKCCLGHPSNVPPLEANRTVLEASSLVTDVVEANEDFMLAAGGMAFSHAALDAEPSHPFSPRGDGTRSGVLAKEKLMLLEPGGLRV